MLHLLMWHAFNKTFLGVVAASMPFGLGLTKMLGDTCQETNKMPY